METAIIIHGSCDEDEYFSDEYPSLSNSHWLPWLQKQLLMEGYVAQTPEMPRATKPDYELWRVEFERYSVTKKSVLVGHSTGGGFLLRWLTENPVEVYRTVLVAPFLDPIERRSFDFFDFTIDPRLTDRTDLHMLSSDNDDPDLLESAQTVRETLPQIGDHRFSGYGHFTFSAMKTVEFPQLKSIVLSGSY